MPNYKDRSTIYLIVKQLSKQCPDKPNVTNNIVCSSCGGAGHIARDCRSKRPGQGGPTAAGGIGGPGGDKAKIDEEYMSLMAELGEGPPPDRSKGGQSRHNSNPNYPGLFDRCDKRNFQDQFYYSDIFISIIR